MQKSNLLNIYTIYLAMIHVGISSVEGVIV